MKELIELAEGVKEKLQLEYNAESVEYLEGFLDRTKASIDPEKSDGFITSIGAFVGQCIIENYGGKWSRDENGHICVEFNERNRVYPFAKTRKQFEGLEGDRIFSFYSIIPDVFNLTESKKRR